MLHRGAGDAAARRGYSARVPSEAADSTYDRAEELISEGSLIAAEELLVAELDRRPRASQTVYLLGACLVLQHRFEEARRVIDRAHALKPWVREMPRSVADLDDALIDAETQMPDWIWPRYRRLLDRWFSVGLTLPNVIRRHLRTDSVFVVQVGANDGRADDPLSEPIVSYGWSGVLVEPQREPFAELQRNYSGCAGIELANCAISDHDGVVELYVSKDGPSTLGSLVPTRNALRGADLVPETVDAVTFDTLVDRYGIDRVDVLQIDTEGYDAEILRMFDLARFRPIVVNLEFYCLTIEERVAVFERLDAHGYAWRFAGRDLLAVDRERIAADFCVVDRFATQRSV